MSSRTLRDMSLPIVLLLLLAYTTPSWAYFYPDRGSIYYNGRYYLDSYLTWDSPGPWLTQRPGYEHDLVVKSRNFFEVIPMLLACTTFSNLPAAYDDCPTAGVDDDPGVYVFSFGTFDARRIAPGLTHFGGWRFVSHGTATSAEILLRGQENRNVCQQGFPPFMYIDSIWCMFSVRDHDLRSLVMHWNGVPFRFAFGP